MWRKVTEINLKKKILKRDPIFKTSKQKNLRYSFGSRHNHTYQSHRNYRGWQFGICPFILLLPLKYDYQKDILNETKLKAKLILSQCCQNMLDLRIKVPMLSGFESSLGDQQRQRRWEGKMLGEEMRQVYWMCSKTAPKRQDDRLTQRVSNHGWLNVWFLVENTLEEKKN